MNLEYLNDKTKNLTTQPGVYIMKDKNDKIIYIGKAKNLKNRVSQYFKNVDKHDIKVGKMVESVWDFSYIITDSEFEALVLECSMIKKNAPKYNILLKDDKGYNYIKITNEPYPKILSVKQKLDDKCEYIGPFVSGYTVSNTVNTTNTIFKLPTCNRKFPRDFNKERPCLNYYIKKCRGYCLGQVSQTEYMEIIKQAKHFINKGSFEIVQELKKEMLICSDNLEFEKAGVIRDRINAIANIKVQQKVILDGNVNQDAVSFVMNNDTVVVSVLKFREGRLLDKDEFIYYNENNINTIRQQFLPMYYITSEDVPEKIFVDEDFDDLDLLQIALSNEKQKKVTIAIPQKGENKKIILLATKNAMDKLQSLNIRKNKEISILKDLQKMLGMKSMPKYIESYDISNLGDDDMVAGMISVVNGKFNKKGYKKFKVKSVIGQDDYGAMTEVIERRILRYLDKDDRNGFNQLPDLILLDGGKGHLSVITKLLKKYDLDIAVFGMVKDNKHKTRAISTMGSEIDIKSNQLVFQFVTKIQDEVHRFSIDYQRNLSKKRNLNSILEQVTGIGGKKSALLLKHFKSIDTIKNSTIEEISEVVGITLADAKNINVFFENR